PLSTRTTTADTCNPVCPGNGGVSLLRGFQSPTTWGWPHELAAGIPAPETCLSPGQILRDSSVPVCHGEHAKIPYRPGSQSHHESAYRESSSQHQYLRPR